MTPLEKKHIVWYADLEKLDMSHPWVRRWWLSEVLTRGRLRDVLELDWQEIKRELPSLNLPAPVFNLWRDYFASQKPSSRNP